MSGVYSEGAGEHCEDGVMFCELFQGRVPCLHREGTGLGVMPSHPVPGGWSEGWYRTRKEPGVGLLPRGWRWLEQFSSFSPATVQAGFQFTWKAIYWLCCLCGCLVWKPFSIRTLLVAVVLMTSAGKS